MKLLTITTVLLLISCSHSQINFGGRTNNNRGSSSASIQARGFSSSGGRNSVRISGSLSSQGGGNQNSLNFNAQSFSSPQKSGFSSSVRVESDGCMSAAQCSSELFSYTEFTGSQCKLRNGSPGFKCTRRNFSASSRRPFQSVTDAGVDISIRTNVRGGSSNDISRALRSSQNKVTNITSLSTRRYVSPLPGTGAFYHAKFQRQARADVQRVGKQGLLTSQAALDLSRISTRQAGSRRQVNDAVNFGSSRQTSQNLETAGLSCSPSNIRCGFDIYRSADGSCNNLREPRYGMADTSLNRIMVPEYSNGVDELRRSVTGAPLPSARLLSTKLATDLRNTDQKHTYITMTFGQFVDHDLTHSPIMKREDNRDIDCCRSGGATDAFCAPIDIPASDPFFRGRSTCMNLVRSVPAPDLDCGVRYREQVNQITHWLDASNIYGSDLQEQRSLRSGRGGRLGTVGGPDFNSPLLPNDNENSCEVGRCFKAGDGRVNENPMLSVMHTMFMREHNRVADNLQNLNPGWSDEKIFQEAKKFVTAEYQHIVYNEWLPAVVGKKYMNLFGLYPKSSGYSNDYDPTIDPRITNEFSTAAFRFGHSLIPSLINVYNSVRNSVKESFELKDSFNKPALLRLPGMVDGLVAGLTRDKMESFDSGFVDDITNNLFDGDHNGMDLVALNIQRGRDHGLGGYNKYREVCGLGKARSFSDLSRQMSLQRTQELQRLYSSVDDVDLFVGIFSERPNSDAMVGPTALCIIGKHAITQNRAHYNINGR